MKTISVVTSAYNEEESIDELARRLRAVFDELRRISLRPSSLRMDLAMAPSTSSDGFIRRIRDLKSFASQEISVWMGE